MTAVCILGPALVVAVSDNTKGELSTGVVVVAKLVEKLNNVTNYKGLNHRDRTRARTLCCFGLFFSSFEHAKNLLIMSPNNTKNSTLKCDFLIFNYE